MTASTITPYYLLQGGKQKKVHKKDMVKVLLKSIIKSNEKNITTTKSD